MNTHFSTGYSTNLIFYILECMVVIIMNIVFNRIPWPVFAPLICFFIVTTAILYRGKKKKPLNEMTHMIMQSMCFVIVDSILSIVFDSAQVFIYAMCFSSVLAFVYLNNKLMRFQMIQSMVVIIFVAAIVSIYVGSRQTMLVYTFGTVMLFVTNWVITSMTNIINYQYRKSMEQERSLDDLLKVVEAKCDEARDATRSKSKFLANMSHEIRTPMSAVMGMNEMILRESNEQNIRNYAVETKIAAESLLHIINDILDITKIEEGKLTLIPVEYSLAELIKDLYTLVRFRAEGKNLAFSISVDETLPSKLEGDDLKLKQVLINLLSNAVKYTKEGSVALEISNSENGGIRFVVRDTGIGIKEEDLGRLFDAFERLDKQRNRSIQGTGLGLSITASLLKLFGSELMVKSEYGKGSEFSFVINQPIADHTPIGEIDLNSRGYTYKAFSAKYEAPGTRILVVDDNSINRKVFINLLKGTKIEIDDAAGGKESVQMAHDKRYDIIFMDHMMPEVDGIAALQAIRADKDGKCSDVPVIALTANAIAGSDQFYLNKGFDGFLSKPIVTKALDETLFRLLGDAVVKQGEQGAAESGEEGPAEDSKDISELPVIDGIDWGYAITHFPGCKLLIDTVRLFRVSIKKDAEELEGYFRDIDSDNTRNSYRIKVHSMKNSAALIGIIQLAGMAMELEKASRSGDIQLIKAMHPIFITRWQSYFDALQVFSTADETLKNSADFREELEEIFVKINDAAIDMDVDTLDEMSAKLDGYSFSEEAAKKIDEIQSAILDFDVEKLSEYNYRSILQ